MIDTILIILGIFLAVAGIVGCIFPLIPGPPLSFLAIILLSISTKWQTFSITFIILSGFIALLITIGDYFFSSYGAKRYGASKVGIWGSIIGMIIGALFFPPWGFLPGAIVGTLFGEYISGKKGKDALRAGWGVILGTLAGTILKLAYSSIILILYILKLF